MIKNETHGLQMGMSPGPMDTSPGREKRDWRKA